MDLKISGIYKISNIVNGKIYISQGKNIHKRWIEHKWELNNQKHRNIYIQRSWNKYGEDKFSIEIIEECLPEMLNERETYWIRHFNSTDNSIGYNCNDGGNSRIPNAETREKHRIGNLGQKRSPETCKLIGDVHRGMKMSDEAKLKMRNAKLGKKLEPEHVQKIIESRKGYSPSEETRKKISAANTGRKASPEFINKMTGRKASEETKSKQSKARLGKEPWNKGKTGVYSEETKQKMKNNLVVRRGEESTSAKLKEFQIKQMMQMFEEKKLTNKQIAEYFGVSLSTVKDIKQGRNWTHITGYKSKKEREAEKNVSD